MNLRIGQTSETKDEAAELASIFLGTRMCLYLVDIGVDEPNNIVVYDVPSTNTERLYEEAKRRNPNWRAALLYEEYDWTKDIPKISFDNFLLGNE